MPRPEFSVCVLLYGGFEHLARRCLSSIEKSSYDGHVQDFRIALNRVSPQVHEYAVNWASRQSSPTIFYQTRWPDDEPALKYPVMRKMFQDSQAELARTMMWFDDDSYLSELTALSTSYWWDELAAHAQKYQVIGQTWGLPITSARWEWIMTQPWYNPKVPRLDVIRFPQGAWWCANSGMLNLMGWPIPELRHCGGDSLFGEVLRHTEIPVLECCKHVHINADSKGQHSKAARRGFNERPLGEEYEGTPLPLAPVPPINRWVARGT